MSKKKTSISLDEELLEWINKKIREKRFASVTHAIEYSLMRVKNEESQAPVCKSDRVISTFSVIVIEAAK